MTTATQQIPSNPALDFANLVLTETNNGLELIDILHDIAQGIDEDATTHDRITASNILLDRGLGKCPKQVSPNPRPKAKTDNKGVGALREASTLSEAPSAKPESSRLVNQIDHALNDSLGPAPEVESAKAGVGGEPALTEAEGSIHFTIQQHILAITNNGRTLFDTLAEIARAKDDPKAKPSHRARATRILIDRVLGTNTALPRSAPHTEPAKAETLSSTGEIRRPREVGRGPRRDPTHEGRGHTHPRPKRPTNRHI